MATDPAEQLKRNNLKAIIAVVIVAGVIAFLAGFGLDLLDEKTVSTAKDLLNAGVEAIFAILASSAGLILRASH
jgi:Mg2+/citrate symporter